MKIVVRLALVLVMSAGLGPFTGSSAGAAGGAAAEFRGSLDFPAAFTFAPDGRVFYGERSSGGVRIIAADGNSESSFFTVPNVVSNGEQGLLGIALHPDYPATPHVFVYATRDVGGVETNQILRITDNAGTGEGMLEIWTSATASGQYHDGGHIAFGPDGKLWEVGVEAHDSANAQKLSNDAGKVLRMNPDGTAPGNNPFGSKLIWSYGLRNSYGFDFDPRTGRLWETENGPGCNDEINRIRKGRNFGWGPNQTCGHPPRSPLNTNRDGRKPAQPEVWWTPTVAPTGAAFCGGCGLGSGTQGRLFVGQWNTSRIVKVRLDVDRRHIVGQSTFYQHDDGIASVEVAPDGRIFFSDTTSIWELTT